MTCKLVGLTLEDMEYLTIGACLDYATEYLELKNEKDTPKKAVVRNATQADFDNF